MEVELGWGVHDTGELDRLSPDGTAERHFLSRLLEATEACSVPISFDVVGHLFLESCSGAHDGPHRPDWFQSDPGTDYRRSGLFYGPDMVSQIEGSSADHEICTHTFSHVLLDEVSRDVCDWELSRVQELHRERLGRPTRSLVPPRHQLPPYEVLHDHGIEVVRPAMKTDNKTRLARFKELLVGPLPHWPLSVSDGIVETYCTTYPSLTAAALPSGQGGTHPVFGRLPETLRERYHLEKLKRATGEVAEENSHLHLWCHLFDLSNESQFEVVQRYLQWLDEFRREEDLAVVPMEDLPAYV